MRTLEGRTAIVTGAGSVGEGIGNGRAIAVLFARHGARLVLVDSRRDAAEATARLVEVEGGEAVVHAADVSEPDGCRAAVEAAVERFAAVHILVNNVGITGARGTAVDVDPDAWDDVMRVNVKSMMLMAKYAVPRITEAGGGAIVNIASIAGLRGGHPSLAYPTSKGAVVNMTRAMASHHAAAGIRVNCVAPGLIYTPRVEARGGDDVREARRRAVPLQREGTAWDVAEAALFLAGEGSRWITGQILTVDAGQLSTSGAVGAH